MSKLKDFVLNHKKAVAVSASVIVVAASLGCGALIGFKAGEKANSLPASNYNQQDVNGGLTEETVKVQNSFSGISTKEAQDIALRDAGLSADEVTVVKLETDVDDGIKKYDVEFVSGANKYEYEIDVQTGEILSHEIDSEKELIAEQQNQQNQPDEPEINNAPSEPISLDEAKAAALADAGLADAVFTKAKLDYDDNRDVYDIEFYSGTIEYEYEIAVKGGSIIKREIEYADEKNAADGQDIGMDAAKEVAVKDAGLEIENVRFYKEAKDTNGNTYVYEIEFNSGYMHYEYEINALSGKIIKKEYDVTESYEDLRDNTKDIWVLVNAKDAALADAGVNMSNAVFTKTKLEREDGKNVYSIKFISGDREYEYEIDAETGNIISKESENIAKTDTAANTGKDIGIEEAKLAALRHCGLSASDVTFTTVKKDRDDGVDCYELEFCTPEHEYEYEIHCYTGEILHNECHNHDRDDDDCGHNGRHH